MSRYFSTGYDYPPHFSVNRVQYALAEMKRTTRNPENKTPRIYCPNTETFLYTQYRQLGTRPVNSKKIVSSYVSRQLPGLLKEKSFDLGTINKIFAASWVSDRQVVFGTKCNKLIVMDLFTKQMAKIPSMRSSDESVPADCPCGIHAIATNPSKTLLATGAHNTNDVAVYKLPTFDPVCVGEAGHDDWIFDIKWLDDQFLVTGSRDSNMSLWRIADSDDHRLHEEAVPRSRCLQVPEYHITRPLAVKRCHKAEKVRALAYNTQKQELAALSLNAFVHIWDAQRFTQNGSFKLKHQRENVCMCVREDANVYAVGSQSHITLLDPRAPKAAAAILSKQRGCGIRSVNFNNDMLSIGTGSGGIFFLDLRAMQYLDMSCGHPLLLNAGNGWLSRDETYREYFPDQFYPNAIYAHCYDDSGTRLFAAGGPLPAGLYGNYAAMWC